MSLFPLPPSHIMCHKPLTHPAKTIVLSILLTALAITGCSLSLAPASTPSATASATQTQTPTPTVTPTFTPTATPTPTETPFPLPPELAAQLKETGYSVEGTGFVYTPPDGEKINVPGNFDPAGFHVSLEGGTAINIPLEQIADRLKIDPFGLLQVYDDQGIISAEYDPGAGQPNSPDYIPSQGWVDIKSLAESIIVAGKCIYDQYRGIPNSAWVNAASTEIFRSIDALDNQTGEVVGKFLLWQFVSRDKNDMPLTGWMLVQAESVLIPRENAAPGIAEAMQQYQDGVPFNQTEKNCFRLSSGGTGCRKDPTGCYRLIKEKLFCGTMVKIPK